MLKKEYHSGHVGEGNLKVFSVRKILGYVLLMGGISIAIWVFVNVYSIFTEPAKLTPFQELVSGTMEAKIRHSNREESRIEVPAEFLSYMTPLILLAIAAGIASTFVSGGIRLLAGSSVTRLSGELAMMHSELKARLDRISKT